MRMIFSLYAIFLLPLVAHAQQVNEAIQVICIPEISTFEIQQKSYEGVKAALSRSSKEIQDKLSIFLHYLFV